MRNNNQIKNGTILAYLNLFIGNIIPFIYTPIMLRILGQAEYGLYGIAQSIMNYIGLMNFGISGTIVRYISKYRSEKNTEGESRVCGLFLEIYLILALLILVVGGIVAQNINGYSSALTSQELAKLRILVLILTINTGVALPFNVYSSIIIAHERFVFHKLIALLTSIATPIVNLAFLFLGYGSVGLAISSGIVSLASYLIYYIYTRREIKLHISFKPVSGNLIKEILVYSFFVFIASLIDVLYWATDRLIIGSKLGAVATAKYNVGAMFNTYLTSFSTAISGILIPRLTKMVVDKASDEELSNIFIRVGRIQFIIVSFILSAFIVFGKRFVDLWAGPDYSEAYYVALLTMVPVSIPLIQNTGLNILYALNKHRFRSILYLIIAGLNVALTFLLVDRYGIIGAAAATAFSYILGNVIIINWYYYRKIHLNIPLFWKNILKMSVTPVLFTVISLIIFDPNSMNSLQSFLIIACVYTIAFLVACWLFMMNSKERKMVLEYLQRR